MSETIFRPQPGMQHALIEAGKPQYFIDEILGGGARGGGKSYGVLLEWASHAQDYGAKARGIMVRKSMPELDDIIAKSREIYPQLGANWKEQKKEWHMREGAVLRFRHLETVDDASAYQGHSYTRVYFEELGNYPDPSVYNMMKATLRSADGVPCGIRSTCNPGGPGHQWLKQRFIDVAPSWTPVTEKIKLKSGKEVNLTRVFIPSLLSDNPALSETDPMYEARLHELGDPELVRAWLDGDWDIAAGGIFSDVWRRKVHVVPDFIPPQGWYLDRAFDMGSAAPFSVAWYGEHPGEEHDDVPLPVRHAPRGTVVAFAEWYGWNGQANTGCRMSDEEIAIGIIEREEQMGIYGRVRPGPADNAIFPKDQNDHSTADVMARHGVRWTRSDKSSGSIYRGVSAIRRMLQSARESPVEQPALYFTESCYHAIRTLPTLPRDTRNPEVYDSKAEDHWADQLRYRLASVKHKTSASPLRGIV